MTWEHKAEKVIAKLCRLAYNQTNYDKNGKKYKRYRPYSAPEDARILTDCLGMKDRQAAEIRAKETMMDLRNRSIVIDD